MLTRREPALGSGIEKLPDEQRHDLRKAIRLEWITIGVLSVTVVLVGLVAGQSQAMRSAWFEDMISLVPPIAFLVATRLIHAAPSRRYPYGPHRAIGVAHLVGGVALFAMGFFLVYSSVSALINVEKPPIGLIVLFGHAFWSGWLMIVVMIITATPMVILGHMKIKLAKPLHDKVLYADADMARADWGTAIATTVGVLGIGFGIWWADAVAALVIAASIIKDGVTNIRAAISALVDSRATRFDNSGPHHLTADAEEVAQDENWVADARARVRELGHVFHTEMFVVPAEGYAPTPEETEQLTEKIADLDWKFQDVVVVVVSEIDPLQVPAEK